MIIFPLSLRLVLSDHFGKGALIKRRRKKWIRQCYMSPSTVLFLFSFHVAEHRWWWRRRTTVTTKAKHNTKTITRLETALILYSNPCSSIFMSFRIHHSSLLCLHSFSSIFIASHSHFLLIVHFQYAIPIIQCSVVIAPLFLPMMLLSFRANTIDARQHGKRRERELLRVTCNRVVYL